MDDKDDENPYTLTIVLIVPYRPPREEGEPFAPFLPARVGGALGLHVVRVLVEELAQDVRPHAAPDRKKGGRMRCRTTTGPACR